MKIGIFSANLQTDIRSAIRICADIGVDGIQLWNSSGELAPWELDKAGRAELLQLIKAYGMEVSALCADFGYGFTEPTNVDDVVDRTKQVIDMCPDFETNIVTTHIGVIPEDPGSLTWEIMQKALIEAGKYAEDMFCCLAAETGPEEPALMVELFSAVDLETKGIKINYDPANLAMNGFEPVGGVEILRDYIVHTHAKDGVLHPDGTPEEKLLGEGAVDFPRYVAALKRIGFDGYVVVEREAGEDREGDIRRAVEFLRKLV